MSLCERKEKYYNRLGCLLALLGAIIECIVVITLPRFLISYIGMIIGVSIAIIGLCYLLNALRWSLSIISAHKFDQAVEKGWIKKDI